MSCSTARRARRAQIARIQTATPLTTAHDIARAAGHVMACLLCGAIGKWSGAYGIGRTQGSTRATAYILCASCASLGEQEIRARVETEIADAWRWEDAS